MAVRQGNTNSLFSNTSRYVHGGVSETQNKRIEWWERTIFPSDLTDTVYTVENVYEGRLDLISAVFYGETRYWWLIAQYNNILDPFSEVMPGRKLLIPTKERLMIMLTGSQGGTQSQRELTPTVPSVIV